MIKNIFFENHPQMENIPIIFHKNSNITPLKSGINVNWHENIEILHVTKGEGYFMCDEKRIYVKTVFFRKRME